MKITRRQLFGVFLTTLSILSLEITLTRIFSVMMRYHFAFLAISIALMGSAVAGVTLYFFPRLTQPQQAQRWIGRAVLVLALSVPITFLIYLRIPFNLALARRGFFLQQLLWLVPIYLDLLLPFFLSGAILSLTLSAWPRWAGRIYWADLMGAALGCLLSILTLDALGGAGAVLSSGIIASLAALVLSSEFKPRAPWIGRQHIPAVLVLLAITAMTWGSVRYDWIDIAVRKTSGEEPTRVYEQWNAYSRVTVYETEGYPFFWAISDSHWERTLQEGGTLRHALLLIDGVAGTPIQEFNGDLNQVAFLRYDLVSFVYHVMEQPQTLVIGPGGGRDVLAALTSGAPHVTAVEVNQAIVDAVQGPYADFAGQIYQRPDVSIVVADARGFIARSPERYDVIQASLIDTWAAGGSSAYALSENSLYTQEAFRTYYDHLTERGIFTISRWYLQEEPAETLRLVSTGIAGWRLAGVNDPSQHVAVIVRPNDSTHPLGLATALFKRTPFTPEEVSTIRERAEELGFSLLYGPGLPPQEDVGQFITTSSQDAFIATYPMDIAPATDNRPFFFNMIRFGDLFNPALSNDNLYRSSKEATLILVAALATTGLISSLFIALLHWLGTRQQKLQRPSARMLVYFGALGLAFMMVEGPAIQQLTVYLGHPIYSLSVVLFSLLLCSGFGSMWAGQRLSQRHIPRYLAFLFPSLTILIVLYALGGSWLLHETIKWPLPARLGVSFAILGPLGFLMGMPFPTGIRWAGTQQRGIVPWLWGINGFLSVVGSVLSVTMALHVGFRITLFIAAAIYAVAGIALIQEVLQAGRD